MSTLAQAYRVPDVQEGSWRIIGSRISVEISLHEAEHVARILRVRSDLPPSESSLAPIFFNSTLENNRDQIRAASTLDELIAIARTSIPSEYADRLDYLRSQDNALTDEQEPLSLASAKLAALLLLNYRTSVRPDLVVTASGYLQIEWFVDAHHRLVVECHPDNKIRFVMLYGLDRAVVECPAVSFVSRLQPYPVWKWFHGGR